MTKMFGNLTTDNMAEAEDRLGGGYQPISTDVYNATLKMVYAGESARGAQNVTIVADINGQEYRQTIYITSAAGDNFFIDKADGKTKRPLPGFVTIDELCLLTTGDGLANQDVEEKTIKVYDFDQKKEVPKAVPVLVNLLNKPVKLGIQRIIEDKRTKGDDGQYHPNGETRTINEIDKVFHPETDRTVSEYRHEVDPPEFMPAWIKQNQGKDRNKSTAGQSGGAGQTGTGKPMFGGSGTAKKSGLFANKS